MMGTNHFVILLLQGPLRLIVATRRKPFPSVPMGTQRCATGQDRLNPFDDIFPYHASQGHV